MGFFDNLFGSKKPAKPEAISVSLAKGAVGAVASGRVEATEAIPDPVFAGEPLVSFDRDKVKKAGHPDIIMIIVTNSDDYPALAKVAEGQVKAGDTVIATA